MTLLNTFSELQECTDRQLDNIRKTMHKKNEKITKEMKTIKIKIQIEILAKEYNAWNEEFETASTDLTKQKNESVN